jgi:hypothetical protein
MNALSTKGSALCAAVTVAIVATHAAFFTSIAMLVGGDPVGTAWRGESYEQLVLIGIATLILGRKTADLFLDLALRRGWIGRDWYRHT